MHVDNVELQKKVAVISKENLELQKKAQQIKSDDHSPVVFSNRLAVAIPTAGTLNEPVQLQLAQPLHQAKGNQDETPKLL